MLSREQALRLWTAGSAWFSGEQDLKGTLSPGMYADLAVLSADFMAVPPDEIRGIRSVLTMLSGRIVHGADEFDSLAPPLPPASPDWSPVRAKPTPGARAAADPLRQVQHARSCHDGCADACGLHGHEHRIAWASPIPVADLRAFWGALGCSCWAV